MGTLAQLGSIVQVGLGSATVSSSLLRGVDGGPSSDKGLTLAAFVFGLACQATAFACLGEPAVAFVGDVFVSAIKAVFGGDVANGAVQADVVVVADEVEDDVSGVVQREGD